MKAERGAKLLQLESELRVAESAAAIAQWNLDQQTLRSPIDGVVLDRPVSVGTRMAINDHIMQLADVRPEDLVMRAAVDEENVAEVRPDQIVRMALYSFPGRTFEGKVTRIYDKAEPDRRTFEVDVAMAEPDPKLAAGMTGELAFIVRAKAKSLVAPSQALQSGDIYTVRNGKLAKVKEANVGLKSVERIELTAGLRPGDRVVISPVQGMREGESVRVAHMDPIVAADLNKPKTVDVFKAFR
jgi:membrane fusion protein (multidrug efflux system)